MLHDEFLQPGERSASNAPPLVASAADTWLRDAFNRLLREARLFGRTFVAFAVRPGRSARAWQAGERIFMNPLAFAATAAGVYWATVNVLAACLKVPTAGVRSCESSELTDSLSPSASLTERSRRTIGSVRDGPTCGAAVAQRSTPRKRERSIA